MKTANIKNFLFIVVAVYSSIALISIGVVFGDINTWGEGYKISPGATVPVSIGNIDGSADSGLCQQVTNPPANPTYFVPTKTTAEWNAFQAEAPALGVNISACAPTGPEQKKVAPPNLDGDDLFGTAVGIDYYGLNAVVGAPLEDNPVANGGGVYVFTYDGANWNEQQRIMPSGLAANDNFGNSVDIDPTGNQIVVGAMYDSVTQDDAGAVYVFNRSGSTWSQAGSKITASDREAFDRFGEGVASMYNNYLVIGAPGEDTGAADAGAFYVFSWFSPNFMQRVKKQASDPVAGAFCGHAVDSGESYFIAGCYGSRAAYVFTGGAGVWNQLGKLTPSDPEAGDYFGYSVAISYDGVIAAVGAPRKDSAGADAGAVYIFKRNTSNVYVQTKKITASDAEAGDRFGEKVSLNVNGYTLAVSASLEATGGAGAGAAYVFTRDNSDATTWTQKFKFQASDKEADDNFGTGLALSGNRIRLGVGASNEDTEGTNAGAAYFFNLGSEFCGWEKHLDNTDWAASGMSGVWTGATWQQKDPTGLVLHVAQGANFNFQYQPTKFRLQTTNLTGNYSVGDSSGGISCGGASNAISGQEIPISCSGFSRMNLYANDEEFFSNIEFYCCPGDCTGMECNDSCGVSCGTCGSNSTCNKGTCQCQSTFGDCNGTGRGNDADGCEVSGYAGTCPHWSLLTSGCGPFCVTCSPIPTVGASCLTVGQTLNCRTGASCGAGVCFGDSYRCQ